MADASPVLAYIDTAVAVATFLISERLPATFQNIRAYFSRIGAPAPADSTIEDAVPFVNLLVIHPDLLEDLIDQIKNAIAEYRRCLKNSSRPQERAACDRRAEKNVCDTLNRVRDRNNGDLPGNFLKGQWSSFDCVRV